MPIWGVDSYSPAHLSAQGTGGASLYDYVCNFLTRNQAAFNEFSAPQFWGRYLNESRPASSLTTEERDYLHQRNCRILLVYNDTCWDQHHDVDCRRRQGERTVRLSLTGYEHGATSAGNACRLAKDVLDAPDGTRLYADLEGWFVNAEWINGWCTEVVDISRRMGRRYTPGIYGRVLVGAELAFAQRRYRTRDPWSVIADQAISGQREREDRLLRQGVGTPRGGRRSNTSRQPSTDASRRQQPAPGTTNAALRAPIHIWSNMPRWTSRCNGMPDSFDAHSIAGGATRTVVWQYGMSCPNLGNLVDMDLATQQGFDEMWGRSAG